MQLVFIELDWERLVRMLSFHWRLNATNLNLAMA